MAEKRMFTQKIIDSDAFLDMPLSTQALYFHLNMRADDDGFVNNPKRIQRTVGASEDDLKLLIVKRFVIGFDSGVIVIKHWRMHNTLRKDRYNPTQYQEELSTLAIKENNVYTENVATTWQPNGNQLATQNSIDKYRLVEYREVEEETPNDEHSGSPSSNQINYESIRNLYNEICVSFPKCTVLSDARKKAIKARISSGRTVEDFETLFRKAEASDFLKGKNERNWRANFDWLIKDGNFVKVLDGNYDNRSGGNKPKQGNYTREEVKPEWMRKGYSNYMEYLKSEFADLGGGESIEDDPDLMAQADAIRNKYKKG